VPSFHALGSYPESSRHRVLKSVEAHRSTSMPSQCRCCHQRLSILRRQRRNILAIPTMPASVPRGKSLQRQLGNFFLARGTRSAPTPGKPGASSSQIPRQQLHHSTSPAVHPIGWVHRLSSASRAKTPKTPISPKASDPKRRHHHRCDQVSVAETQVRLAQLAEASQVWAGHALLRRTLVDGCFSANSLPRDCSRSAEKAEHFCTPNNPFRRVAPSDRSPRAMTTFPRQSE
jgi:hypothetical protein